MKPLRAALLFAATVSTGGGTWAQAESGLPPATQAPGEQPAPIFRVGSESENTAAADPAALRSFDERLRRIESAVTALTGAMGNQTGSTEKAHDASAKLQEELSGLRSELKKLPTLEQIAAGARDPDLRRRVDQIADEIGTIRRLVPAGEAEPESTWSDPQRLAMVFSGVAAAFALGAIISVLWMRPDRASVGLGVQRRLQELREEVTQLSAALKSTAPTAPAGGPAAESAAAIQKAVAALRSHAEATAREQATLAKSFARIEALGDRLQPAVDALDARLAEIAQARAALAGEREAFEAARRSAEAAATARAEAETSAAKARAEADAAAQRAAAASAGQLRELEARLAEYDRLLPDAFSREGPLASWKSRVVVAAGSGRAEAASLLAALVRWQIVRHAPTRDRDRWLEAVDGVGRACHAYLATEPAENEAEILERLQGWTRAFKTPFEEAFPSLKLNAAYPGDRFDTDRMEAVSSISGGRQVVHHSLSWFILEKSGESTRVIRRAQVVTA